MDKLIYILWSSLIPLWTFLNHSRTWVCDKQWCSYTSFNISFCGNFAEKLHKKLEVDPLFHLNTYSFSSKLQTYDSLQGNATVKLSNMWFWWSSRGWGWCWIIVLRKIWVHNSWCLPVETAVYLIATPHIVS